ncbi:type II secretion system F family protein [Actinomadura violacea]|uniref:Type II secretion system F family protein n=1 Tax=Actinomadura violacea TaxID=2819934 RepID=A0ABS3S6D8_9ACTN|nr:type II secretion system F family protein [Actinomadura violacea]MBO2463765.1 type II secretion system F family protein [Actinomadura violacea]
MMTAFAIGAAAALCTLLGAWGLALATSGERVTASALPPAGGSADRDVFVLDLVAERIGTPFSRLAVELVAPWRRQVRARIDAAGRPGGLTVESYARRTAGYVVLFGVLGLLLMLSGHSLFGVLCLLGVLQPELTLYGRRQARKDDIQRSMPDFLDVLAVTVSAGLGFRTALARAADSMPGPLAEEFLVALRQMELGTPRREAFEDLRGRAGSEAVNQFVTALLQAEELGAPLSGALMDISNDMRRTSAQWAKRKAQRTTPKITAVTMGLTLPALMLIVLGALFYGSGAGTGGLFGN